MICIIKDLYPKRSALKYQIELDYLLQLHHFNANYS